MMPSSGPPIPKVVGGPTPPLVSRGSEEEWKMKIPTGGPPTLVGGGSPTSPPTGGREASAPTQRGGEMHPPTQWGGEVHPPREGRENPPSRALWLSNKPLETTQAVEEFDAAILFMTQREPSHHSISDTEKVRDMALDVIANFDTLSLALREASHRQMGRQVGHDTTLH